MAVQEGDVRTFGMTGREAGGVALRRADNLLVAGSRRGVRRFRHKGADFREEDKRGRILDHGSFQQSTRGKSVGAFGIHPEIERHIGNISLARRVNAFRVGGGAMVNGFGIVKIRWAARSD